MHKGTWESWGRDLMCSCQLSATLSWSDGNCTDKKENTATFHGSNALAMALIVNVPAFLVFRLMFQVKVLMSLMSVLFGIKLLSHLFFLHN